MTDRLIKLFEQSDGFVSGEQLSGQLGVSRTAVWKQIERLKQQGYIFEAAPRKGYRLVSAPEPFPLPAFMAALRTESFGRKLHYYEEVESTQAVAQQLVQAGAREGTLVLAEEQTAGRGRLGRSWHSPRGKGLWFSVVLKPEWLNLAQTPQLTLLTAVAVCRAVRSVTSLDAGIKWPNDLLVGGKKIGGILLEASIENGALLHVIAGIGLSVNLTHEDFPPELLEKATSLAIARGSRVDRSALLAAVLSEWERLYKLYREEGFAPVKLLWEALAVSLGRPIVCTTPQGRIEGIAERIDEQGALILKLEDGSARTLYSGDIDFK
ncbi:BirA family transcriptional regulator, biotin operon repressor / biotin-[acetyl-CoA-carboxylase] ligase [Paenibacillus sp. UNCCL117]|uniref:biotin--[acetyl-CoA-carboxylase] ligase n=1 Tax=unclassified Paenibacillus TaxID=185978 RepID=UPI0008858FA6|nr:MULTISPECIES: biotin--[acetyl-CoA-carboxylase] ligase [unclassified Paenibacillus]SDC41791.1 BirA family transcriptional regulator, biotin operon repressor / biotin-[acetyl-CoA-carboxylase] ligase [Paenibacillus sp. cl123]SFW13432.1 BirA family transcriptional regulator, biotin operon repressor / biotin-[acetyl-CoA-carboxylase] ligase [Paenibacillus sp. UNCCL117]